LEELGGIRGSGGKSSAKDNGITEILSMPKVNWEEAMACQITIIKQYFVEILFSYAQSPISTTRTGYVAILNKLYHVLASKINPPEGRNSL
jgi:hypothetical protein